MRWHGRGRIAPSAFASIETAPILPEEVADLLSAEQVSENRSVVPCLILHREIERRY